MKAQNLWRSFALLLAAALLLAGIPAVSAISQEGIKEYPAEGGNIYVDGNTVVDADETITKVANISGFTSRKEGKTFVCIRMSPQPFSGIPGMKWSIFIVN